jgi:hypothetical protein
MELTTIVHLFYSVAIVLLVACHAGELILSAIARLVETYKRYFD